MHIPSLLYLLIPRGAFMKNIFQKIIDGDLPCDKVFENERILAFNDIYPVAPVHILILPKKAIPNLASVTNDDIALLGEIVVLAKPARPTALEVDVTLVLASPIAPTATLFCVETGK